MHPEERLLLEQAWQCFESAGYNPLNWLKDKDFKDDAVIWVIPLAF